MSTSLLGTGLYSLPEAARLVGADVRAARRWLLGYRWKHRGGYRVSAPLWRTQHAAAAFQQPVIGFRDLLEMRLVNAFARRGVKLSVIRATADAARSMFDSDYPLTMRRFLTDGKRIFAEAIENNGEQSLIDPAQAQYAFADIVTPSLYAGIDYEGSSATRWYPMGNARREVVLDPTIQFGAPIVSKAGVPTSSIFASFIAEGRDERSVSRIFDIAPSQVKAAVKFEEHLLSESYFRQ